MSTLNTDINRTGVIGREYLRCGGATEVITPGQLVMEVPQIGTDTISKRTRPTGPYTPLVAVPPQYNEVGQSLDYAVGDYVHAFLPVYGQIVRCFVANTTLAPIDITLEDALSVSTTLAGVLEPVDGGEALGTISFVAFPDVTKTIAIGETIQIDCRFIGNV